MRNYAEHERLAEQIRARRIRRRLSQDSLAALTGCDRKTINRIENGATSPSMDLVARIAAALECNVVDLVS